MKRIVIVSCVYIAAIVGAGFASGQEIVSFFVKYGRISVLGVLLCGFLFGFFAFAVLDGVRRRNVMDFDGYLVKIMPGKAAGFVNLVVVLFMMSVFCAMMACSGEAVSVLYSLPKTYGITIVSILCLVIFFLDRNCVMAVSSVLGAGIILGIIGVCWFILQYRETQVFANVHKITDNWLVSAASYASYNILTAGVILADLSRHFTKRREALWSGIISGILMTLMLIGIWVLIDIYYGKIPLGEIPMLTIVLRESKALVTVYGLILFAAMLTTAVASGYGVIETLKNKYHINRILAAMIVVCGGYLLGGCRFSVIIDIVYRICGYMGFILLGYVMIDEIKNLKK